MDNHCNLCGNNTGCDEESLKGSTIEVNGCPVVMCCGCEDEAMKKLAKRKGLKVTLDEDYAIRELRLNGNVISPIKYGRNLFHKNVEEIIKRRGRSESYWELRGQRLILTDKIKQLKKGGA